MLNLGAVPSPSRPKEKRFSRFAIGDFTFADYQARFRQKLFLDKNITRVLARHEKRTEIALTSSLVSAFPLRDPLSLGELSGPTALESPGLAGGVDRAMVNGSLAVPESVHPTESTTMASKSRASRRNAEGTERSTRRSIRNVLDRAYQDDEAELVFDLNNIRKKLNFKTNCLDDSERPAKRQKRNAIKCLCHLTVWDNRDGTALVPLVIKSTDCRVTTTETATDGYFVDIEMDNPFVIQAEELKVSVARKQGSVSVTEREIVDKYFLEVKIIPCRSNNQWPPIPILGKSDGDHFARDIRKTGAEELQGAVVTRYVHLPQAPDPEVPLSVFFLHEGRTYRTKYGLQVGAFWRKSQGEHGNLHKAKPMLDLDSFRQDTPNRINGVSHVNRKEKEPQATTAVTPNQPEVCYTFASAISAQEVSAEFRTVTTKGYLCPLCSKRPSAKLNHLLFHLKTLHPKYSFQVQKPRRDLRTNHITLVSVKVDLTPTVKPREETKEMDWEAPTKPFDLPAYVDGDHSWVQPPKRRAHAEPLVPSRYTSTRLSTRFPLAADVPDFRQPRRKKHGVVKLETKYNDLDQAVFTSVSHRAVSPSEDPRSETDDEIDADWQIQMHMERLDSVARREGWSVYERELRKRWDRHRMEEHLEHSRYLSNCLVRFVRKHRSWLKTDNDELIVVFLDFLEQLKDRRVIDDDVVSDVNELIFGDYTLSAKAAGKQPARETDGHMPEHMPGQSNPPQELSNSPVIKETPEPLTGDMLQLPLRPGSQLDSRSQSLCGHCSIPVRYAQRHAMWCADPACETPRTMYHKKCVLHPSGTALVNGHQKTKGKGKEKAKEKGPEKGPEKGGGAPIGTAAVVGGGGIVPEPAKTDLLSLGQASKQEEMIMKKWACKACVARHIADGQRKEQEKQRERDMVSAAATAVINAAKG